MFNSKLAMLIYLFFVCSNVFGASQGVFSSEGTKGIVILNNQGSNDATFMWELLSSPVIESGAVLKKKLVVSSGQFEILCSQAKTSPSNVSCTLTFVKLPGSVFEVVVDKSNGLISASLTDSIAEEVKSQLSQKSGFFVSPDNKLSICPDCGNMNSEVQFNWLRD